VLVEFSNRVMVAINSNLGFFRSLRLLTTGASSYQEQIGKLEKQIEDLDKTANSSFLGARGLQRGDRDSALRERINAEIKALKQLQTMQEELSKPFQPPSGDAPSLLGDPSKLKDNMDEHVKLYLEFIERERQLEETRQQMLRDFAAEEAAKEQARRDGIAATLEARRLTYASEEDLERERYARELQNLIDAQAIEFLTEEQHRAMKEQAEQRHYENLANIRTKGSSQLVKIAEMFRKQDYEGTVRGLAQITAATASSNKKMFNMNKAFAVAEATIKGYKAVLDAYAWGNDKGGPPLGAAMAALAGAFAFAQVRAISSQQYSGGGSSGGGGVAPSVSAAAGGAIPVTNVGGGGGSSGQTVTIQLQGEVFNREQVRNLITQINEAVSDGSVLRLA
jgi:hypothetical protein